MRSFIEVAAVIKTRTTLKIRHRSSLTQKFRLLYQLPALHSEKGRACGDDLHMSAGDERQSK